MSALLNKLSFNGYQIWSTYPLSSGKSRPMFDDASTVDDLKRMMLPLNYSIGPTTFPSAEDIGQHLLNQYFAVAVVIHDNDGNLLWRGGDPNEFPAE